MKVIVDTCVWSLALRRGQPSADLFVFEFSELVVESRVQMMGPIRQELLSGIKEQLQFDRLKEQLRNFPDIPLDGSDYENAARLFNLCRANGVQGASTDFLICAVAERMKMPILTTDNDFQLYQKYSKIRLLKPRALE